MTDQRQSDRTGMSKLREAAAEIIAQRIYGAKLLDIEGIQTDGCRDIASEILELFMNSTAGSAVQPNVSEREALTGLNERLDRLLLTSADGSNFVLSASSAKNIVGIVREWTRVKTSRQTPHSTSEETL